MSALTHRVHLPALHLRRPRPATALAARSDVLIRGALQSDAGTLERLAALDEAPALPAGETLIAEVDGRVVAALDPRSGRTVSDPFARTAAAVDLLALRARQLRG